MPVRAELLTGQRRRIIELLQRKPMSAQEIADSLGVTHNAVRAHLAVLVQAALVREAGRRKGSNRPTVVYELAPRAESALSAAYVPFVAHLLRALGAQMTSAELHDLMRDVGRSLAADS